MHPMSFAIAGALAPLRVAEIYFEIQRHRGRKDEKILRRGHILQLVNYFSIKVLIFKKAASFLMQ